MSLTELAKAAIKVKEDVVKADPDVMAISCCIVVRENNEVYLQPVLKQNKLGYCTMLQPLFNGVNGGNTYQVKLEDKE